MVLLKLGSLHDKKVELFRSLTIFDHKLLGTAFKSAYRFYSIIEHKTVYEEIPIY